MRIVLLILVLEHVVFVIHDFCLHCLGLPVSLRLARWNGRPIQSFTLTCNTPAKAAPPNVFESTGIVFGKPYPKHNKIRMLMELDVVICVGGEALADLAKSYIDHYVIQGPCGVRLTV